MNVLESGDLEKLAIDAIERCKNLGEPVQVELSICLSALAGLLTNKGEKDMADVLYQEALQIHRGPLKNENPQVVHVLSSLALIKIGIEAYDEALKLLDELTERVKEKCGAESTEVLPPVVSHLHVPHLS